MNALEPYVSFNVVFVSLRPPYRAAKLNANKLRGCSGDGQWMKRAQINVIESGMIQ